MIYESENTEINKINEEANSNSIAELKLKEMENQELSINILGTIRSGKTTLINSIIGNEILPSDIDAYTAAITSIENFDENKVVVQARNRNRKIIIPKKAVTKESLKEINNSRKVMYIDIDCKIENINLEDKKIKLVDTPCFSNLLNKNYGRIADGSHIEVIEKIITNIDENLVLYMLDSQMLGIDDDTELLKKIANAMKEEGKQSQDRFMFIVTKCDVLDEEMDESVSNTIEVANNYLRQFGIENPNIFPVTAELAKLIRMNNKGCELTKQQKRTLNRYDDYIEDQKLYMEKFSSVTKSVRKILEKRLEKAQKNNDDYEIALIHSGVPAIEETIKEYLNKYMKSTKDNQEIKINKNEYKDLEVKVNNLNVEEVKLKNIEKNTHLTAKKTIKSYQGDIKMEHKKNSIGKVEITYNPYEKRTNLSLDGQELLDKFEKMKNERIQFYLVKNSNWKGLIPELSDYINDNFEIVFTGRAIDFEDVNLSVEKYNKDENKNIKIQHIEARNDSDILKRIDQVVGEFNNGPIAELKSKEIQETYEKMKKQEFNINVLATMSSGKSTLINSMLGDEILPSAIDACTATIAHIKNSNKDGIIAQSRDKDGNIVNHKKIVTKDELKEINNNANVMYMDIECKMENISSKNMELVLVDTPGPNNSRNENHGKVTDEIINDKDKSVVLYVLNAQQIGITDDNKLLNQIANAMKRGGKQSQDRFIFVINKCDALDEGKGESVINIIKTIKDYLRQSEIENPNIFPVTAELAKVIRMNNKGNELTRQQNRVLNGYDDYIEYADLYFEKFASVSPSVRKKLEERLEAAKRNNDEYEIALIHSGVPAVEETIKEYLNKYAYPIKIEQAINTFMNIIKEKEMMNSLDESLSENKEEYKKLKEQIVAIKEKLNKGNEVKKIKDRVNGLAVNESSFEVIQRDISFELGQLTMRYKTDMYEEEQANIEIRSFKNTIENLASKLNLDLERAININIIEKGENLIEEYQNYLGSLKDELNVGGFTFEKMNSIQKIKLNDVDDLININKTTEDIMEKRTIKAEKSFWNPFSWFNSDTIVEEKVGERTLIDVNSVIRQSVARIIADVEGNIGNAINKANSDVEELKIYFTNELDKLDKLIIEIVKDIESKTQTEEEIKNRLKENEQNKIWLEGIIKELDSIMKF